VEPISLGYRSDLMMLTLQGAVIEDRGDHLVVATPSQPTFHWGNFLLFAAAPADAGELGRWQRLFTAEFPDATHQSFGVDTVDGSVGDTQVLADADLIAELSVVLTAADVHPPARANARARLRMLESDDDWAQALDLQLAVNEAYDDDGYRVFAQRRNEAMRVLQNAGHGGWFGAFDEDRLVSSLGVFGATGGLARYQSVQTHPDYRNRGLAGTLVHHAGRYALTVLGARTLVIVADPDHVASRVYRSVGFDGTETQVGFSRA
jgi:GNAT superfamily N-acetyltransferase